MPSWSKPILDAEGRVVGIACGRSGRRSCSVPGCGAHATIQCDFPVTRKGKPGTCDRYVCRTHATNVGPDRDFCLPHARVHEDQP